MPPPEPGWTTKRMVGAADRPLCVLLVEDSEDDAMLLERALRAGGYRVFAQRVDNAADMESALAQMVWDVVTCDCALPNFSAPQALAVLQKYKLDPPFIVVSGTIGEEAAAALMKAGAHDYIAKANLSRLAPVVARELGDSRTRAAHRAAEARLRTLAYVDVVTELPNRNLLFERIEAILRSRARRMALMLIDVVGLTDVRKTLGVFESDAFLRMIARRFVDIVGTKAVVAHLGADQFAVLAPGATDCDAEALAAGLLDSLHTALIRPNARVRVSAHIGIALGPGHGDNADGLLRRAEIAAECARLGSATTCVYSAELDNYSEKRLSMLSGLWQAAEQGELSLAYQPKLDLKQSSVRSVEALLRWHRPGHGLLMPEEFIPLAEDSGSIRQLTAWVVDQALGQCAAWRRQGLDLAVAVNLPATGLLDGDVVDWLASELSRHQLPGSSLEVEVTESTLIRDPAAARTTLVRLRELGVHSAIDDFGAGYSSLAYLRTLPVGSLKIDRAFLTAGLGDTRDASIVRSAISLAHNLQIDAVAEGVEHEATLQFLRTWGCDAGQGHFIGRPMPAAAVPAWISAASWAAQ